MMRVSVVVPTIGRPSLDALLSSLARSSGDRCCELIVVDDRHHPTSPLVLRHAAEIAARVAVVQSGGRGPACARNVGWRHATAPWICFLDDDVLVSDDWLEALRRDLDVAADIAGSQGSIAVPLPPHRAPNDWERNVAGLANSWWITADMAYRRVVLERVGGFDERFPRAYREDSDLALRVQRFGGRLIRGSRRALHPVRPANRWISVRLQRGNADDVLMRALHGPRWRSLCGAGPGRMRFHAAVVLSSAVAVVALLERSVAVALASSAVWATLVSTFAYARIAPGPRTVDEVVTMALTSAAIPYAAVYHRVRAFLALPRVLRDARA